MLIRCLLPFTKVLDKGTFRQAAHSVLNHQVEPLEHQINCLKQAPATQVSEGFNVASDSPDHWSDKL